MAGPSLQDMQDQFNQAQQNTWAPAVQQQPVPSIVGYPPLPPMVVPPGALAMAGVPMAMSKLSLFAIALCLMLLGVFTFLGGFFLGMWFESPRSSSHISRVGEIPALGMLPPQQQDYVAPQMAEVPAQGGGGIAQGVRQGAQGIGFGGIASTQAGYATQSAVTSVRVPGVPSFLTPLITATQYAVGQQLGYKAQQKVSHGLNGAISNAPQSPAVVQPAMKETQVNPPSPQNNPNVMPSDPLSVKTPGEPAQEMPSSAPLSQGEKGDYTVQLGVYASKENATSLVNHLQELNYSAFVTEGKSADGNALYYVFSGDYKDYKMALDAAYQYVAQSIPGAIVVKMTQKGKTT